MTMYTEYESELISQLFAKVREQLLYNSSNDKICRTIPEMILLMKRKYGNPNQTVSLAHQVIMNRLDGTKDLEQWLVVNNHATQDELTTDKLYLKSKKLLAAQISWLDSLITEFHTQYSREKYTIVRMCDMLEIQAYGIFDSWEKADQYCRDDSDHYRVVIISPLVER